MDCERVQGLLSDFLDGSLPDGLHAGVDAHLRACPPCRGVKEGLEATLLLLRGLPPGQAPPELLEGVRRRIPPGEAPERPLWKKLFLPAHIKIPLEAAAAVLLFFLVYGAQKEDPALPRFQPPAATMEASPAGRSREPAEKGARGAPGSLRAGEAGVEAFGRRSAEKGKADTGKDARTAGDAGATADSAGGRAASRVPLSAGSPSQPSLPAVPAQRVSTAGERIDRAAEPGEEEAGGALPRIFAAPISRSMRPVPFPREVTVEVSAEDRPGLENRISAAVLRLGGSVRGEPASAVESQDGAAESLRIHLPVDSEKPFLAELARLGSLPREEGIGGPELPLEPSPEVVAYTVRIRVR
jgi:hypothetical protein